MYQKEIIYMSLFRDGVREKNAGYLKVSGCEETFRIELQVKNLPGAITGNFPIRLQSEAGWREADVLAVKEGSGKWSGIAAEQILRVEIILSDMKRIRGESRFAASEKEQKEEIKPPKEIPRISEEQQGEETSGRMQRSDRADRTEAADRTEEKDRMDTAGTADWKETADRMLRSESAGKDLPEQEIRKGASPKTLIKAEQRSEHVPLYENKWEQLLTTYEQIHPYGDNRIYVKLEPKDFIVLRENYQHLVNNSFLLHGFYNYRYLILGKEKDFYLGVPGVFYEREKMVALMFGFEAFECEGGEAEEGKFGYYLRKVEL